jgi:biotin transport system substrate-specific component
MTATTLPTLADRLWPAADNRILRNGTLLVLGSLLLTATAKFQVPFYPVPMTLQTLAALLIGATCGWRLGAATVAFYLAQGALGLPVFAGTPEKGIGLAYMMGPTGGYLVGFVLAAAVTGWLAERGWDRHLPGTLALLVLGAAAIYLPGLLWLGTLFGWDQPILAWGLYPFLLGEVLKIALAAATLPLVWRAVKRRR